jgi:hypothetical protein
MFTRTSKAGTKIVDEKFRGGWNGHWDLIYSQPTPLQSELAVGDSQFLIFAKMFCDTQWSASSNGRPGSRQLGSKR